MKYYASEVVNLILSWKGRNEKDGSHRYIIDIYNRWKPLPRGYKVKYTDAWCATTFSSVAIKLGYTDIIPVECSCAKLIELAKEKGIWIENDRHIPQLGEGVLYDWNDNGKGDCKGYPEHIGIVTKVNVSRETFIVTEGNKNNAVEDRELKFNARYIRGFISPKYDAISKPSEPLKSISEVANEVMRGLWGNGSERKERITQAGYDYERVQQYINAVYNKEETRLKSVSEVAKEVINGLWGNGSERKKKLEKAGYDYKTIQKEVNRLLKG